MRNHETGVETGVLHQEGRQTAFACNQLINTAFGDVAQLGHGDGEEVEHQGQRLAVEVAGRHHDILIGEHRGVVGHGVDFGFHHILYMLDGILAGAVHLRDATE